MKRPAQSRFHLGVRRYVAVCGLLMAVAGSGLSAQQVSASPTPKPRKTVHAAKPKPIVPESIPDVAMPAPPPPEVRAPEQMPPAVPQVSWDGTQLTITADNSTLADILVAVRARMGAEIDVPTNASRERMAVRLGPGPAREVIATLLSYTDFDYIIQASDTDPLGIQNVLLTPRGKSDAAATSASMDNFAASARRANRRFGQGATPAENSNQENSGASETTSPEPVAAATPAPVDAQPAASDGAAQAEAESAPVDTPPMRAGLSVTPVSPGSDLNPPVGTTQEQRIQTLQSLYQQRRQMVQDARKTPAN